VRQRDLVTEEEDVNNLLYLKYLLRSTLLNKLVVTLTLRKEEETITSHLQFPIRTEVVTLLLRTDTTVTLHRDLNTLTHL
jgi:hypothetical protein